MTQRSERGRVSMASTSVPSRYTRKLYILLQWGWSWARSTQGRVTQQSILVWSGDDGAQLEYSRPLRHTRTVSPLSRLGQMARCTQVLSATLCECGLVSMARTSNYSCNHREPHMHGLCSRSRAGWQGVADKTIRVWSGDGTHLHTLKKEHKGGVYALAVMRDATLVAGPTGEGTTRSASMD